LRGGRERLGGMEVGRFVNDDVSVGMDGEIAVD